MFNAITVVPLFPRSPPTSIISPFTRVLLCPFDMPSPFDSFFFSTSILFLSVQHTAGSSYTFPAPVLESAIYQGALVPLLENGIRNQVYLLHWKNVGKYQEGRKGSRYGR